jgi:hypothetical protein
MSYKQYNVAYHDTFGNVVQMFTTPTHYGQAVKRQKKHPVGYEFVTTPGVPDSGRNIEHPSFIIERTISDWQVSGE